MPFTVGPDATALNRLRVTFGAGAVTPAPGESLDAAGGQSVLQIWTVGLGTLLVSFTLQNPSFSFLGRTASMNGTPLSAAASGAGIAAEARFLDSNGIVIAPPTLTVGASGSGADIIIGSTTITSGETVTIVTATFSVP